MGGCKWTNKKTYIKIKPDVMEFEGLNKDKCCSYNTGETIKEKDCYICKDTNSIKYEIPLNMEEYNKLFANLLKTIFNQSGPKAGSIHRFDLSVCLSVCVCVSAILSHPKAFIVFH